MKSFLISCSAVLFNAAITLSPLLAEDWRELRYGSAVAKRLESQQNPKWEDIPLSDFVAMFMNIAFLGESPRPSVYIQVDLATKPVTIDWAEYVRKLNQTHSSVFQSPTLVNILFWALWPELSAGVKGDDIYISRPTEKPPGDHEGFAWGPELMRARDRELSNRLTLLLRKENDTLSSWSYQMVAPHEKFVFIEYTAVKNPMGPRWKAYQTEWLKSQNLDAFYSPRIGGYLATFIEDAGCKFEILEPEGRLVIRRQ